MLSSVRFWVVSGLLCTVVGCNSGNSNDSPALPPSTPPPPSLTGADAAKANNPRGGSSSAPDPNPDAHR